MQVDRVSRAAGPGARRPRGRLLPAVVAGALCALSDNPLQAQTARPVPPPQPPAHPLPVAQRLFALELAVQKLPAEFSDVRTGVRFVREDIDILSKRIDALEARLAALDASYTGHTHQLSVWGSGCVALPNLPRGGCAFVIGNGQPVARVTSRPVQLPPR